ncbi:MAG: GyrI-like domain-containing protein [Desulfobacterales bacterium]|nr:GyrI-like domain-containing protein [Desulfobacterales bacterium]
MKIFWTIGVIILLVTIIMLLILLRYGLLASVKITEKKVGPYLLIYKKHIGDYKNVGSIIDKLYYDLKDNYGIDVTKGFGLYYDNPQEVPKEQLRSIVGCIIEGKLIEDLNNLTKKYGVKEYPESKSVVAEFPYKGKLSIILGVFKVYPKLNTIISNQKHPQNPIMELYDQPNEKIEYISSVDLSKEVFDSFLKTATTQIP